MGGFLSGTFWGAIVGIGALFISSFSLERQELSLPQPSASSVELPGGSEFDQARPETDPVVPTAETRPGAEQVETVEAPDDSTDEPPTLDTAALDVPEPTIEAPGALGDAPEPTVDEQPEVSTDSAVEEAVQEALETPDAPGSAPAAEAADPAVPTAETEESDTAGVTEAPVEESPEEPQVAALPEPTVEEDQPDTEVPDFIRSLDQAPSLSQPEVSGDTALPESGGTDTAAVGESPEAPQLPQIDDTSLPESDDAPAASAEPEAPAAPATEGSQGNQTVRVDDGPSFLQTLEELENRAEGVETDRLPQAGASSLPGVRRIGVDEPEEDPVEEAAAEAGDETETVDDGPALRIFASAFENLDGNPILSVVLVHQGRNPLTPGVLSGLPQHVSFAVDAGGDNSRAIAKAYRDAGREVVMMPSLPQGATPQDVEQAMQVNLGVIPEAVAIMDVTGSNFQSDRSAVQQIVDVVADTGHGLITFPRGLNTAHQEAQRAGVATGLIFRNVDGGGETQDQIRRALDRAAFRARQNDGVILVGTTSPATVSAIVEWALGNRSSSVTIAPISASLNADG